MAGLLATILSVAIAFWMYLDATGHGIGKDPVKSSIWELSAGGWATWALCLWPLGLLVYLIRRGSLIARAAARPVHPKNKTRSLIILAIVSAAFLGFNLSSMADQQPGSSSSSTYSNAQSSEPARVAPQLPAMTDAEIQKCEMEANIIVRSTAPLAQVYGLDYAQQKTLERMQATLSPSCLDRVASEWAN